jgi:hypothetical protein
MVVLSVVFIISRIPSLVILTNWLRSSFSRLIRLCGLVLGMREEYALRIPLQGLFYALRSFFSVVGFGHDLERLPCTWSHTPCRHPRMSGDHCPFVDSPQRPARLAEGHLPFRHCRSPKEAQQAIARNRS